jgi:hypothetical protein
MSNEYFGGKLRFNMDDNVKKYFIDHYNNDMKRLQMVNDFANDIYKYYHTQFKKMCGINPEAHNPTDFGSTVFYTMNPSQINSIDSDMKKLQLVNIFEITKIEINDRENIDYHNIRCCCGKVIYNIITMRNKTTGIAILVGSCCVNKNKMIPENEIKKMNKTLKEKKDLIKKKKKFNMCSKCEKYNISKVNVDGSINDEDVCAKCKKKEESNKRRLEEEEAKKRHIEEAKKRRLEEEEAKKRRIEEAKKRRLEEEAKKRFQEEKDRKWMNTNYKNTNITELKLDIIYDIHKIMFFRNGDNLPLMRLKLYDSNTLIIPNSGIEDYIYSKLNTHYNMCYLHKCLTNHNVKCFDMNVIIKRKNMYQFEIEDINETDILYE